MRDDVPRPNDGIVAHIYPRQQDGATADPDVMANSHGLAALEALSAQGWIARGIGCQDVHSRADLTFVADINLDNA